MIYLLPKVLCLTGSRESRKTSARPGFKLDNTGSLTAHSDIIVTFSNPPPLTFYFLSWRRLAAGVAAVVLCSVAATLRQAAFGRGYFWLPPCLNPAVILWWIIHASSPSPNPSPALSHLSPHILSFSPSLSFLLLHFRTLSSWAPSFNTSSLPCFIYFCHHYQACMVLVCSPRQRTDQFYNVFLY